MPWLRSLPPLYYVTIVVVLLALWTHDARGMYLAIVCFVIGTIQYVRAGGLKKED